jgi:O-antigen biosynthesis protein
MKNALICAARSAYYAVTEPHKLAQQRKLHEGDYPAFEVGWDDWRPWAGEVLRHNPLISIIVPTHNRLDLLIDRAIKSIWQQSYRYVEILICAHGCTDGTRDLKTTDSRLRIITVPRRRTYPPTAENHWFAGPVDPINAGLAAARGKWIARLDDDDCWDEKHLETMLRFAQGGNYEFVSAGYQTDTGSVMSDGGNPPIGGVQTWLYRSYLSFMRANPACWRKTNNRVNDLDLADRFRRAGVRIGHYEGVTARVLPRPGETVIGLKAYQQNRAETERKYAFR